MKILALEPYYGGSHRAFLDGWTARSRHTWQVRTLPAHKWKWRMRHAAITFAAELSDLDHATCDVLWCSDMLNLAEFRGLAPPHCRRLPAVVYFHENQLTYPVRCEDERDYHFVLTNLTSALAADQVWFNSAYHRDVFLGSLPEFLRRMPDHQPLEAVERIRAKSSVHPPGIEPFELRPPRSGGPLRILWAARWEHDKGPRTFFDALLHLRARNLPFRVSVVGEQFREAPAIFEKARGQLAEHIDRWGFQEDPGEYRAALQEADVVVSTAEHEFFGISMVEAMSAGAFPVFPQRLSYPEILADARPCEPFLYDGSPSGLADRLCELASRKPAELQAHTERTIRTAARFGWDRRVPEMDRRLEELTGPPAPSAT